MRRPLALVISLSMLAAALPAAAQQRLRVEATVGQSTGLTSYRRDVLYAQETAEPDPDPALDGAGLVQPYLADETNTWGAHLALRLLIDQFIVGISTQWHLRDQLVLHHQGDTLLSQKRQRPNGSWDDAGVDYAPLEQERVITSRQRNRGLLFVGTLAGGWCFEFFEDPFTLRLPLTLGVTMVNIAEPAQPYVFGLKAEAGAGASYRFTENFALTGGARLGALGTIEYNAYADAARRAQLTGRGTEAALFSTLVQASLELGVMFIVR